MCSLKFLFLFLLLLCCYTAWGSVEQPFTPLLIALSLDGLKKKDIYHCYKDPKGKIWFSASDLKVMGFPNIEQQPFRYKDQDYYLLDFYEGVTYNLDEEQWILEIQTPVGWHPKQTFTTEIPLENGKLRPESPGVFLNYEALSGYNGFLKQNNSSAFTELGLFTPYGVGTSGILINGYDYFLQTHNILRLDTTWTLDQPEHLSSWRFGDSISSGLDWNGAVRFAGVQYATNFSTQPTLVTMPQPSIYGEANLPSAVEVLINGINTQHQTVDKGSYEITQLPVVNGQGQIQLVNTDMLGRQQVSTFNYYASPLLLKPGLSDYSYEIGSIRKAFASDNFNYGRAMGVATYQLGINNRNTAGFHVELLQEQQNVGVSNNYLLGNFGVITLGVAGSNSRGAMRFYDQDKRRGLGGLLSLGLSRQTQFLSYGILSTLASHDYLQLGQFAGTAHPNMTVQSYVALATQRAGSLSVSYTHINNNFFNPNQFFSNPLIQPDDRVFIFNYNKNLWGNLFLNVGVITGLNDNKQGFINLVMPIGSNKTLSVNENALNQQHQETIQLNKNLPLGNGYGYQLTAATNKSNPVSSQFNIQTNQGLFGASYLGFGSTNSMALNARGSIIGFNRRVFPARYVDQAFALVEVTGLKQVGVYSRNQLIGKTNRKGYLYIPELLPYQKNELYVDNKELPMSTQMQTYTKTVVPYRKSGVLVRFAVNSIQNVLLSIHLKDGSTIPAGSTVYLDQDQTSYPVGYNGQVFISSSHLEQLSGKVVWDDQVCRFNIQLPASKKVIQKEMALCA